VSYRAIAGLLFATCASAALAAYGRPHWSYLEFVEETQVGRVSVRLVVDPQKSPARFSRLEIRVGGRQLKIPREVVVFATDPHLDEVSLWRLGSVVCMDGEDCKMDYPVELHIPYGERHPRDTLDDACETSELFIYFQSQYVESASYYVCEEIDKGTWQDLYRRPAA
jgi:hypothetical protein